MTVIRFYRDVLNHVELQSLSVRFSSECIEVFFCFFLVTNVVPRNCEVQVRQENPRGFVIVVFHKEVTPLQIRK